MNRQDMALSGLNPATQALSGNDLILLTQNTPNGLQSVSATLVQLLQYLFVGSGETDGAIANLGYLKQVYTLNPNSGLIGDGRSSNPMSVNFSYLDTLYVNETDFTNYQGNVNTQIDNINNSISQGTVTNSRNVNTGAGLVGGGDLSADRTISMGAPSSITSGSSNSASGDTHSHELAPGAVTNTKLANNSVTDEKIQSVSASKITGVIPSENLPPASASINVIDNLNSSSVNDALSANQGRVLAEQLVNKLNLSGGTVTGTLNVGSAIRLTPGGTADFSNHVTIGNGLEVTNLINAKTGIWADRVVVQNNGFGGGNSYTLHVFVHGTMVNFDSNGTGFKFDKPITIDSNPFTTTISHDITGVHLTHRTNFTTDNEQYFFNKDVYFGLVQKAANGYTTLPNGLIMQWGRGRITNDGNVVFPIAFPNSLVNVQVTNDGGDSSSHGYDWSLSNKTKFYCTKQGGETLNYSYIALGY